MPDTDLKQYICLEQTPIVDAMRRIDDNARGILFVTDAEGRLTGCLTDGDIRRWIIRSGGLEGTVQSAMNPHPRSIRPSDVPRKEERLRAERVYALAVTDGEGRVTDVVFSGEYLRARGQTEGESLRGIPIIVMAGGKGTRLYPYTRILPKPLIPVGGVPILERILDRFREHGAEEFYLTVNYRKEMIRSYFAEARPPYAIHYVEESAPLGTAGSIALIEETFTEPVLVTNSDILIRLDYEKLLSYHRASGNALTIVSSMKNLTVPYGVLHTEAQGVVASIEEKPRLSYLINTGMYVIAPQYLKWIPRGRMFHMTELSELLIRKGERVAQYPVSEESFLDMGEFEEMRRMEERLGGDEGPGGWR